MPKESNGKISISCSNTGVFWNIEQCSRNGLDIAFQDFKSALANQGEESISVYWSKGWSLNDSVPYSWDGRIINFKTRVPVSEDVEVDTMFVDIVLWALENPAPSNLMVISKYISQETELLRLVRALESKGYNILVAHAEDAASTVLPCTPSLEWLSRTLFYGLSRGVPNDGNKIQMNSSLKRHEANTSVFWDMEDCPIPDGLDPRRFCQNMKAALAKYGYHHGEFSVKAYCDKNMSREDFFLFGGKEGITFVPTGDRNARLKKMFEDILFWALENPKTSTVMMITKHLPDNVFDVLEALKTRDYNFLFAMPSMCNNLNYVWLSESLFGGGIPITRNLRKKLPKRTDA